MKEEGKKERGLLVMTMTMGDNGGLVVEAVRSTSSEAVVSLWSGRGKFCYS